MAFPLLEVCFLSSPSKAREFKTISHISVANQEKEKIKKGGCRMQLLNGAVAKSFRLNLFCTDWSRDVYCFVSSSYHLSRGFDSQSPGL